MTLWNAAAPTVLRSLLPPRGASEAGAGAMRETTGLAGNPQC